MLYFKVAFYCQICLQTTFHSLPTLRYETQTTKIRTHDSQHPSMFGSLYFLYSFHCACIVFVHAHQTLITLYLKSLRNVEMKHVVQPESQTSIHWCAVQKHHSKYSQSRLTLKSNTNLINVQNKNRWMDYWVSDAWMPASIYMLHDTHHVFSLNLSFLCSELIRYFSQLLNLQIFFSCPWKHKLCWGKTLCEKKHLLKPLCWSKLESNRIETSSEKSRRTSCTCQRAPSPREPKIRPKESEHVFTRRDQCDGTFMLHSSR